MSEGLRHIAVLEPIDQAYMPVGSSDAWVQSSSRHHRGLVILELLSRDETQLEEIRTNAVRLAIGNEEIWRQFPELRGEFKSNIRRRSVRGDVEGALHLYQTVPGDVFIDRAVWFYGHSSITERALSKSPFVVPEADLKAICPQLFEVRKVESKIELLGKVVFLLDHVAFWNSGGSELFKGAAFYSPRELIERSDFVKSAYDDSNAGGGAIRGILFVAGKFLGRASS